MQRLLSLLSAAALLVLSACTTAKPAASSPPPKSPQMAKQLTFGKNQLFSLRYLLFLPKGYDAKASRKWPLILFLHGSGERGTDVRKVAIHGPSKYIAQHPDFPFILVSPQCPAGQTWSNEPLIALLDELARAYAVDTARIYLTGLSMGGYGTWNLGMAYPERFAAIAPICGGGDWVIPLLTSIEKPQPLKTLPIWAFHGAKDPVVPLAESQRMVEMAKKFGLEQVRLTVYPEAQHNCWTETYNNPKLYEWFLAHSRPPLNK